MAYGYNFADALSEALGFTGKYLLDENQRKKKEQQQAIQDQLEWWYKQRGLEQDQSRIDIAKSQEARLSQPDQEKLPTTWEGLIGYGTARNDVGAISAGVNAKKLIDQMEPDKPKTDTSLSEFEFFVNTKRRQGVPDEDIVSQWQSGQSTENKPLSVPQQMGYYRRSQMDSINNLLSQAAAYGIKGEKDLGAMASMPEAPSQVTDLFGKVKDLRSPSHMKAWFGEDSGSVYYPPLAGKFNLSPIQQATGVEEQQPQPTLLPTGTYRSSGQPVNTQEKPTSEMSDEELMKLAGYK